MHVEMTVLLAGCKRTFKPIVPGGFHQNLKMKQAGEYANKEVIRTLLPSLPKDEVTRFPVEITEGEYKWEASVAIPIESVNTNRDNFRTTAQELRNEMVTQVSDLRTELLGKIDTLQSLIDEGLGDTLLNRKIILLARHLILTNPNHGYDPETVAFINSYDLYKDHKVAHRFRGDQEMDDAIMKLQSNDAHNPMVAVAQGLRNHRHYHDR